LGTTAATSSNGESESSRQLLYPILRNTYAPTLLNHYYDYLLHYYCEYYLLLNDFYLYQRDTCYVMYKLSCRQQKQTFLSTTATVTLTMTNGSHSFSNIKLSDVSQQCLEYMSTT